MALKFFRVKIGSYYFVSMFLAPTTNSSFLESFKINAGVFIPLMKDGRSPKIFNQDDKLGKSPRPTPDHLCSFTHGQHAISAILSSLER